jgi:hypothetical protein
VIACVLGVCVHVGVSTDVGVSVACLCVVSLWGGAGLHSYRNENLNIHYKVVVGENNMAHQHWIYLAKLRFQVDVAWQGLEGELQQEEGPDLCWEILKTLSLVVRQNRSHM